MSLRMGRSRSAINMSGGQIPYIPFFKSVSSTRRRLVRGGKKTSNEKITIPEAVQKWKWYDFINPYMMIRRGVLKKKEAEEIARLKQLAEQEKKNKQEKKQQKKDDQRMAEAMGLTLDDLDNFDPDMLYISGPPQPTTQLPVNSNSNYNPAPAGKQPADTGKRSYYNDYGQLVYY